MGPLAPVDERIGHTSRRSDRKMLRTLQLTYIVVEEIKTGRTLRRTLFFRIVQAYRSNVEVFFSFMIRVRVPGGVCTTKQWLDIDELAGSYANQTLKLTTRQAYQLHGIIKSNLKRTIKEINDTAMDTIAACGDVNRNVMCNPNPMQSKVHGEVLDLATELSNHLSPRTGAYHEIWLEVLLEARLASQINLSSRFYLVV